MEERIRQKLTETMFWLNQAAEIAPDDSAVREIQRVIEELEKLDMKVAEAFNKAGEQKTQKD